MYNISDQHFLIAKPIKYAIKIIPILLQIYIGPISIQKYSKYFLTKKLTF